MLAAAFRLRVSTPMKGRPKDFWGKLKQADDGSVLEWHPLIDHCADVAACCEALLRHSLIRRRLARLGGRADLSKSDTQRLSALVGFHDGGKFNLGFQNKADPGRKPVAGHVAPIMSLFGELGGAGQRQLRRAMGLDEIKCWAEDDKGLELLLAALAHHGKPVPPGENSADYLQLWRPSRDGCDPFEGIARLSASVRRRFPAAFAADASPLPSTPRFQHAFSGLVTLADWLGSDESVFRFSEEGDPDRIAFARKQASTLLRRIGLDPSAARAARDSRRPELPFVFGFSALNEAQRTLSNLPVEPGGQLVILESETGSGKTEAALAHFFKLFDAGAIDGIYFALPTRTAAVQMHRRISEAVARAFPDAAARPPVVLAVPGYLPLDDQDQGSQAELLAPFETLWNDDEQARLRYRRWAGEHPKRYLAAAVGVGTVDQALLSALMVAHSHLRATSLLRQLLVVDEVHASDTYMARVLQEVLRFHLAAGGHALLLSATLGSSAAAGLAGTALPAGSKIKIPPLAEAEKFPYPLVTNVAGQDAAVRRIALSGNVAPKTVTVELKPLAEDHRALAELALKAASSGARVLVVRNTVRDCVATQIAVEALAGVEPGPLFSVNRTIAPHHARFAPADRRLLDHTLEQRFGKSAHTPCLLAATQTVQQSVDIDADLMLTDLCPIDVMLQRIGRLHRDPRRARPTGFSTARVLVLTPAARDLTPLINRTGEARGEHGLGTVYEDLRVIEATWRLLEAQPILEIPATNRRLVEGATHPEALKEIVKQLGQKWRKHEQTVVGKMIATHGLAGLNVVARDEPLSECRFPPRLEAHIRTRLGEDDRIVEFADAIPGPFGLSHRRLMIPGWLVRGADAAARPEQVTAEGGAIRFRFGLGDYVYDRLGLRLAEATSIGEGEDLADA